jgi:hypothetical protein
MRGHEGRGRDGRARIGIAVNGIHRFGEEEDNGWGFQERGRGGILNN